MNTLRVALLAALVGAASCAQCQQQTQARRGNVDRVADAILVNGVADQNGFIHTFLVMSNPDELRKFSTDKTAPLPEGVQVIEF